MKNNHLILNFLEQTDNLEVKWRIFSMIKGELMKNNGGVELILVWREYTFQDREKENNSGINFGFKTIKSGQLSWVI